MTVDENCFGSYDSFMLCRESDISGLPCFRRDKCKALRDSGAIVITEEYAPNKLNCFGYNTEWYCEVRCKVSRACAAQSNNFKPTLGCIIILNEV